jgi:uncharacterized cupredoxin-like copper-binding protein
LFASEVTSAHRAETARRPINAASGGLSLFALIVGAALSVLTAGGAAAQPSAAGIDVTMSNFKFSPSILHMHRGVTYVLTLHNQSGSGHGFEAGAFLATAQLPAADRARISDGRIEVPSGGQVSVSVTPSAPGAFRFRCTHPLHSAFGMTGSIVVD